MSSSRQHLKKVTITGDGNITVDASVLNDMIERLNSLQREVNQLKQRNFEKDRGKEFESSYTRVLFLMAVTYWTLFGYMALVIKSKNPFLDAIVPTVGFNISTWSLPYVKEWWIQARHYYIHGESESTSLRRLVVEDDLVNSNNSRDDYATTTTPQKKNNGNDRRIDEVPTTEMERGSPSPSVEMGHNESV